MRVINKIISKKSNNMKKIIIIALFFFPLGVFAKGNWELRENKNTLTLVGACSGREARVDLFRGNDKNPIYTSGALCQDGKFEFSDNLLRWKSLPDGDYTVVVDGDKKNTQNVSLKRPAEQISSVSSSITDGLATQAPSDPETKFLGAFVGLQQAILDMRIWLMETKYPNVVKNSINMALDGLDIAVAKVSELVLSAESSGDLEENNATAAEPVAGQPEVQIPQENAQTPADMQVNQPTETSGDAILSADGLIVSEGGMEVAQ